MRARVVVSHRWLSPLARALFVKFGAVELFYELSDALWDVSNFRIKVYGFFFQGYELRRGL